MARSGEAKEANDKLVIRGGWLTAETIAVVTALGYALAFLYQSGLVGYYGVPMEIIRVSPEWVIFIALLLVPSVLGFFTGVTAGDWVAAKSGKQRWVVRMSLFALSAVAIFTSWLLGTGGWASLLLLTGVLLLSLGISDLFEERREPKRRNWLASILSATLVVGMVIVGMTAMGVRAASTQSVYMVDVAHERVLVYSTDSLLVFTDYDPATRSLESTLTFVSSGSIDGEGLSLTRVKTGSLASPAPK